LKGLLKSKLVQNGFAVLLLLGLVYLADLKSLWGALSQLTFLAVFNLAVLAAALIYVSALKWKFFIEAFGRKVSVARLFGLYLVGYFVNLILPSYLGGDVVRSWYIGKDVGQHEALSATILERYTGLVGMVLLALAFMWFAGSVTWEIRLTVIGVACGLALATVLALSRRLLEKMERFAFLRGPLKHLSRIQDGLHLARENHSLLLKALALSLVYHTLTVFNTIAAGYAVGWLNPPFWELFVVLPLILLVGALPITPQGLGIQEGAFFFFLSSVGASPAQALGLALILRAKSYILALLGGLVWLKIRRDGKCAEGDSVV